MLHTNDGPFLIGCWYRPPNRGNTDGISELRDEIVKFRSNAVGVILIGDINVHSVRWLRHSAGESKEANLLQTVCEELGLKQRVTEPTRKDIPSGKDYLLDLVLSDIEVEARVGNKIRDHRFVFTQMKVRIPDTKVIEREVWNFRKADWTRLRECLADNDWSDLYAMNADDAARAVTGTILQLAEECIGKRKLKEIKSTHPWLTEEIVELKAAKANVEGTPHEDEDLHLFSLCRG